MTDNIQTKRRVYKDSYTEEQLNEDRRSVGNPPIALKDGGGSYLVICRLCEEQVLKWRDFSQKFICEDCWDSASV